MNVEDLKRMYPNPVAHPENDPRWTGGADVDGEVYCVGWAFGRECAKEGLIQAGQPFCRAMVILNPSLTMSDAVDIWDHIVAENDEGNFDVAWAWLDKVLS